MSTFAGDIQIVCLGTLAFLIIYILWLSRYRGLDGHLTVRWLLLQGAALLTIMFWRWLPFFSLTSSIQDRELLLMITVLLFAFVTFLMLDLLVRSSRQSAQIKMLTQELAIQRERIDRIAPDHVPEQVQDASLAASSLIRTNGMSTLSVLACLWITICIVFAAFDTFGYESASYPSGLKKLLTAGYLE
jgi:Uncharacterized conserved protein (DUF2304)